MSEVVWKYDTLGPGITAARARFRSMVRATFAFHKPRAEAYMRANAPWTDRTTNARNGLAAILDHQPPLYRLRLTHGVSYGIWLEVKNNGRYAIILPSLRSQGADLMQSFRGAMARM